MEVKASHISRFFSFPPLPAVLAALHREAVSSSYTADAALRTDLQGSFLLLQMLCTIFTCRKASPQQMAHLERAPSSHQPEKDTWATPSSGRATSPFLSSTRASTAGSSTPASPPHSQGCRGTRQKLCPPQGRLSHPSEEPMVAPSRRRGAQQRLWWPINNADRHRQLWRPQPRTDPR